jgi:hypothetical protein
MQGCCSGAGLRGSDRSHQCMMCLASAAKLHPARVLAGRLLHCSCAGCEASCKKLGGSACVACVDTTWRLAVSDATLILCTVTYCCCPVYVRCDCGTNSPYHQGPCCRAACPVHWKHTCGICTASEQRSAAATQLASNNSVLVCTELGGCHTLIVDREPIVVCDADLQCPRARWIFGYTMYHIT